MVCPGRIFVPTAGMFVAVNGAGGGATEVMVCVVVPKLEMYTASGIVIPSGTARTPWSGASGNVTVVGCAYSPSWVPSAVSGTVTVGTADELVLSDSSPPDPPGTDGVNFVCTVSLSPLPSVTGNVTGTGLVLPFLISLAEPTANSLVAAVALFATVLAVAPVTVTAFVAVTDTVRLLVVPTAVCGRVVALATAGAAADGAANAST